MVGEEAQGLVCGLSDGEGLGVRGRTWPRYHQVDFRAAGGAGVEVINLLSHSH